MELPIDVEPGTGPPRFTWDRIVEDLSNQRRRIRCTGTLPPAVEGPVADLVAMTKRLLRENAMLQGQVDGMRARGEDEGDGTKPPASATLPPVQNGGRRGGRK